MDVESHATPSRTLVSALARAAEGRHGVFFLERSYRSRPSHRRSWLRRDPGLRRLSWAELYERARQTATRLASLGVEPQDRIALLYPTTEEFLDAFFGTLLAGAIPVPLYPPVRLGRIAEYHRQTAVMVTRVEACLVLADGGLRRILGETILAARPQFGCSTLAELPLASAGLSRRTSPDALALLQYSSGTTGDPKPVALSHRALMAQVSAINSFWPPESSWCPSAVSWLPLYHDMGLIGCVFTAIDRDADLTLIPPELFVARPATWLRVLSATQATVSPAPNFAYGLCLKKIEDSELDGVDLSNWRVALNGAETVSARTCREFARRFGRWGFREDAMTPVYGLSEAALAVTFSPVGQGIRAGRFSRVELSERGRAVADATGRELVSVGTPVPGCEVEIRSEGGLALEEQCEGEVWVRSESMMDGYFDPSAPLDPSVRKSGQETKRDGWLQTGDRGFLQKGELYLTGRSKDVLIVRGRNHSPEEIEAALEGVVGVRSGCTAAVSHLAEDAESEDILVFVERDGGRGRIVSERELSENCRHAILGRTGISVARIEIVEPGTLPRTSSGKIRRREALERFLAGALDPPERVSLFRMAGLLIRSHSALRKAER